MSDNSSEEGLKIYVTSRGGQYVKADELLASPKVLEIIKKMADILVERKSSDTSLKNREAIELHNQIAEFMQKNRELGDMIRKPKPDAFTEEIVKLKVDWRHVRSVVEAAASDLNWNVEISIDTAENLIVMSVPEDQDDRIAKTTFDFYSLIAQQLDTEVFKAIHFFFEGGFISSLKEIEMLKIHKYYVLDENQIPIAVQIPVREFERLEEAIEDHGLAQLINEVQDEERLSGEDAYNYYRSLKNELES